MKIFHFASLESQMVYMALFFLYVGYYSKGYSILDPQGGADWRQKIKCVGGVREKNKMCAGASWISFQSAPLRISNGIALRIKHGTVQVNLTKFPIMTYICLYSVML